MNKCRWRRLSALLMILPMLLLLPVDCAAAEETAEGILLKEGETFTAELTAAESGVHTLCAEYTVPEGTGLNVRMTVAVTSPDGTTAEETGYLPRIWTDIRDSGRFETDRLGNELLPEQKESDLRHIQPIRPLDGGRDGGVAVILGAGESCRVTVAVTQESVYLCRLWLEPERESPAYAAASLPQAENSGYSAVIEAELMSERSRAGIYPTADRSTSAVSPSDPARIRLNTVGGTNWQDAGDWISWNFSVPEDGLYTFSFRYKQEYSTGLAVTRALMIDGRVPYAEWAGITFPYSVHWRDRGLTDADGETQYVWLTAGEHTLTLEARIGELSDTLSGGDRLILDLNTAYRRIVTLTGTSPDIYQDYQIDNEIPGLMEDFTRMAGELTAMADAVEAFTGMRGGDASSLRVLADQMEELVKDPQDIPKRLDHFRSNIGAVAEAIMNLRKQPLALDNIRVSSPKTQAAGTQDSFLRRVLFRLRTFLASFREDYTAIGGTADGGTELSVWVNVNDIAVTGTASGRDQSELLKRLIDQRFTAQTGTQIKLSLTDSAATLTSAVMSGNGPDAALFIPKSQPINLAMREALTDLTQFEDFETVRSRFCDSALIAYTYRDGVYALPETQTYTMMFVREDILRECGLPVPQTWDEFHAVTRRLQKMNYEVGVTPDQITFETFLLQNGGKMYSDDLHRIAVTEQPAYEAFVQWTDLYVRSDLPLTFDFFNRFRTGEMPIGIMNISMYNQLKMAAPELEGLWSIYPVPATVGEDGTQSRAQSCSGTGCILIGRSRHTQEGYEFIRWWTEEETQQAFGNRIESLLGTSARYYTANIEALYRLPWSSAERELLRGQRGQITDVPITPASYYVTRSLTNAFRRVVYEGENPREVLNRYADEIDRELTRKWKEFG